MIRPRIRTITRDYFTRARENDPASIFRAAKRLAHRARAMRAIGNDRLARVALLQAYVALARALDLRG